MDDDYNNFEEDLEDNYSSDEDNKSFYTNNSDSESDISDDELKKSINSEKEEKEEDKEDKEEIDDIEEEIDDIEENSSDEEPLEDLKNQLGDELIEYEKKIKAYKKENIEMFSKLGMISYLCNTVDYVKNGGFMIDNRNDLEYPNDTEESYVFESILTDTIPFEYIVNKKLINISHENKIICLKMALRCVDENKKIFFPENFRNRFPLFKKNLFNNNVSKEEFEEIKKIKNKISI